VEVALTLGRAVWERAANGDGVPAHCAITRDVSSSEAILTLLWGGWRRAGFGCGSWMALT
jgi:hypothetical protein